MSVSNRFCTLLAGILIDEELQKSIDKMAQELVNLRERSGRLFLVGIGGGAAHASHATCDFRKLCEIEAYCVTDNIAEVTARTNDDGWDSVFHNWLLISKLDSQDALFVFSVGGGNTFNKVSQGIVSAVRYAKEVGADVYGVVGREDGATALLGTYTIATTRFAISADDHLLTPITESLQAVVWHGLVSHPILQIKPTKW